LGLNQELYSIIKKYYEEWYLWKVN
jgi:hypothetical protein